MLHITFALAAAAAFLGSVEAKPHHHHHGGGGANTYTMMVGSQDASNNGMINAFFPSSIHIKTGDSVLFEVGSLEIHTVTFLGGRQVPATFVKPPNPSPGEMALSPVIAVQTPASGSAFTGGIGVFANSGILSLAPGQGKNYTLTFPNAGVYVGVCLIHFPLMNFTITVTDKAPKLSPKDVKMAAKAQIAKAVADTGAAYKMISKQQMWPSTPLTATSTLHYVLLGGMMTLKSGISVDFNDYFPNTLTAKAGDKIKFVQSPMNPDVPHTVSILATGAQPPAFLTPVVKSGTVYLDLNPVVGAPSSNVNSAYSGSVFWNSGLLNPHQNATLSLSSTITGKVNVLCLIHPYMQLVVQLD